MNKVQKEIIKLFPELENKIIQLDSWTPITYNRYCNSFKGSYMAFIAKKGIKSANLKSVVKNINNLFIASQWLMSPGGLPVALASGKFAIQRILKKEGSHRPLVS